MKDGYVLPPRGDSVDAQLELPPGFRFHPTDEELVTYYLSRKAADPGFAAGVIGEVDLNKCEPWDFPWRGAKMGEEWYFFCVRDRKYPAGLRTNRATGSGYWKATGKDKEVRRGKNLVGRKKTLVFYGGRASKGEKTGWVMHEYRLDGSFSLYNTAAKNEWVICRVFQKGCSSASAAEAIGGGGQEVPGLQAGTGSSVGCYGDGVITGASSASSSDLLPPLMDFPFRGTGSRTVGATPEAPGAAHVTCFSNAATGHKSHEGVMDCHSSSLVFSSTTYNNPRSGVSSSILPQLGKLSGEAGLMHLLQSYGYVVKEEIGKGKEENEVGRGVSQERAMYLGSSPSLLSSCEVSRQKVPSGTVTLGDCVSWNY